MNTSTPKKKNHKKSPQPSTAISKKRPMVDTTITESGSGATSPPRDSKRRRTTRSSSGSRSSRKNNRLHNQQQEQQHPTVPLVGQDGVNDDDEVIVIGVKKPPLSSSTSSGNEDTNVQHNHNSNDNDGDQKLPARPTTTTKPASENNVIDLVSDNGEEEDEVETVNDMLGSTTFVAEQHRREQEFAKEVKDRAMALQMQQQQDLEDKKEAEKAKALHQKSMKDTTVGKAVTFVQELLNIETQLKSVASQYPGFLQIVARDDIVALAERTFLQQQTFQKAGIPHHFDLGFHYTKPENMSSIQTGGLLTKKDRDSQNVTAQHNGSAYGDGVYTCDNPRGTWNQRYGNTGLLVARLQGRTGTIRDDNPANINTVVSNSNRWAILKTSEQCIALFQYDGTQMTWKRNNCPSEVVLKPLCEKVQTLINDLLNAGTTQPQSPMVAKPPPSTTTPFATMAVPFSGWSSSTRLRSARNFPITNSSPFAVAPSAPPVAATAVPSFPTFSSIFGPRPTTTTAPAAAVPPAQRLPPYSSVISYKMPTSKVASFGSPLGLAPRGDMPSGKMMVSQLSFPCGSATTSLLICYEMKHGIQASYHPNPNCKYVGNTKHAYLPDDRQGRELLARLQEAFRCGKIFKIVEDPPTSQTYRLSDFLIPHKTMLTGGRSTNGFPDPHYFAHCHRALDALAVQRF